MYLLVEFWLNPWLNQLNEAINKNRRQHQTTTQQHHNNNNLYGYDTIRYTIYDTMLQSRHRYRHRHHYHSRYRTTPRVVLMILLTLVSLSSWALPTTPGGEVVSFSTTKRRLAKGSKKHQAMAPGENVRPPTEAPRPSSPGENARPVEAPHYCCEPPGEDWVCSVKKRDVVPSPCCDATNTACYGACETATDCQIPFFPNPYCNHDYCTTYDGLDYRVCLAGQCQSGWTGARCAQTSDCIVPLNLKEPVCRDAYCQSGQVGARCGGNDDCVDPYICDDTVEGGKLTRS